MTRRILAFLILLTTACLAQPHWVPISDRPSSGLILGTQLDQLVGQDIPAVAKGGWIFVPSAQAGRARLRPPHRKVKPYGHAEIEQQLTRRVQDTLDKILGPGKSKVWLDLEIDFSQTNRQERAVHTEQPGTYKVTHRPARTRQPEYRVKTIRAVVTADVKPEQLPKVEGLVKTTIGIDEHRGDSVVLTCFPRQPVPQASEPEPPARRDAAAALLATITLVMMLLLGSYRRSVVYSSHAD